ncbi:T9SS type A sorting domain-containing protein [Formosa sp. A9]|uniref:T9SS type A sorting domain-containing protein n=1 Tax=Formosa sp. A9 TaxID=3442641 RepID=UPI003EC07134
MIKIISLIRLFALGKCLLSLIIMLFISSLYGQITITDVFPTRVTYQTEVTIIGSNFTSITPNTIVLDGIDIVDATFVSSTQMIFTINKSDHTSSMSSAQDVTSNLLVNSSDTGFDIEYIAPNYKILQNDNNPHQVTKITEIFTNWNYSNRGYWRSNDYIKGVDATYPNDSHELLAFTFDGVTYSTGVNDGLLTEKGITFTPQNFKAYSTNGVSGKSHRANYIATGDLVDGQVNEGSVITSPTIQGLSVYDVITDGVNGLDLGTAITNFNQTASVRFFSGNGQVGAVNDNVPDLLITQVAQPGDEAGFDVYYYGDEVGNVIGRPVKLIMKDQNSGTSLLSWWRVDFYSLIDGNYATSVPLEKKLGPNAERPYRMVGLKLEDFGITGDALSVSTFVENINNINLMAGGSCDIAFLAYNRGAFEIKAPVANSILPRYICKLPSTTDVTFTVSADVEGGGTGDPKETLSYEWSKFNTTLANTSETLNILNVGESDIANYNVRVSNDYGSIVVPAVLGQGGTPTAWDGTSWNIPPAYTNAGIVISDEDRSLIFYEDYNEAVDLQGCDCTVKAGTDVVIPSGNALKIYDNIIVEPFQPSYVEDGVTIPAVQAGTFTLRNNSSLVQINDANGNVNEGVISMRRNAIVNDISDYIYWSSPVSGFNVNNIATSHVYQWDPQASDYGNWLSATNEVMVEGEGYIARVASASNFAIDFEGIPNNGTITVNLSFSSASVTMAEENKHWNLIGNPYPSAILAERFLEDNTNLQGSVSIWTHNEAISSTADDPFYADFGYNYSDQYIVHNGTGTTPSSPSFNGNIAAGQAFFVQLDEGASDQTVEFTNSMRYDVGETLLDNSDFFRISTETPQEKQLIWLSLINESNAAVSTLVGYVDGATYDKDRLYDAYANYNGFNIYSLISDKKMTIQGRPLPFTNTDQVLLGVDIVNNGSYKIGIDRIEGNQFLNKAQGVYLEDTYLNLEHDLRKSPYTFTASKGVVNDRFILKYNSDSKLTVNDNDFIEKTFAYINNKTLHIKSSNVINHIQVYDLTGKELINYKPKSIEHESDVFFPFSQGVYIIGITLDNGRMVTKKIIN